jgi:hypothetical protein
MDGDERSWRIERKGRRRGNSEKYTKAGNSETPDETNSDGSNDAIAIEQNGSLAMNRIGHLVHC